mmetsp:Transcript_5384/g.19642  ORF Transcript_5384/g.19642 Transcript_5384/m.19642 type:complete len:234 (+) Transcript_5384:254-955(+)
MAPSIPCAPSSDVSFIRSNDAVYANPCAKIPAPSCGTSASCRAMVRTCSSCSASCNRVGTPSLAYGLSIEFTIVATNASSLAQVFNKAIVSTKLSPSSNRVLKSITASSNRCVACERSNASRRFLSTVLSAPMRSRSSSSALMRSIRSATRNSACLALSSDSCVFSACAFSAAAFALASSSSFKNRTRSASNLLVASSARDSSTPIAAMSSSVAERSTSTTRSKFCTMDAAKS